MPSECQEDRAREKRAVELIESVDHGRVATSMRALPFLASARHIVADGRVVLRLHKAYGYHRACAGSVVAYGADNLNNGGPADGHWSVQCVGTCEAVEPAPGELDLFGPAPRFVDGEPFDLVYLRIEPQFVTVHELTAGTRHPKRPFHHVL
ncbi:pyridoxamine 5'-phosphate oxidase family protein [Streptomyces sp. NBC_01474]|uniref:pyridoxamine 5'-phosphate oxidase family protein n=1 Tax=unclassified Streptomyces TaxID=2593676 RepID=UPI002DDA1246|nr:MULTISPECIES: pyridoxamine 5'-phosphate oxidase family protein [unclassified Streptomyces]WSD97157.1 pyridoxamine 5'-phosphate oxidase family protein [Streptomyces sp. NBC_01474]